MQLKKELYTILHFDYIKKKDVKLKTIFPKVNLEYANIITKFSDSNTIIFQISLDENTIYYHEIISFFKEINSEYPFISIEYPIYINKINHIYIDYEDNNENNKTFISSELIFQSISEKLLPEKILYDNHELNNFDTFDNKLRKRIGLINIIPNKLEIIGEIKKIYTEFDFDDNNSYQILIRIPKEGEKQYSLTNFDLVNVINFEKNVKKLKESKNELFNKLSKFHKDFNSFIQNSEKEINKIDLQINELNTQYKIINNLLGDYYDNYFNYNNFEEIDLELFHLMFYCQQFLQILKIYKEIPIDLNCQKYNSNYLNIEYEKNISQIKLLNNNNIKEKISFIKIYNKHYLNSFISGGEISYISILNIEETEKSNPYIKALEFIKKIIIELKEESRLFEILLYLDSEVIKNLLIKNDKSSIYHEDIYNTKIIKRNEENPTEYGLNMLNIDEIKNHLYNLIPKFIIRIETDMKFYANYDPKTKIMSINEKRLLKRKSNILDIEFKNNNNQHYVLPIIYEILHELYGHGKLRLINNNENSPLEYRDSKYDYKRCKITKKIKVSDFNEVNYPESGIVFENYISEKRNIIKWLKTIHFHNEQKKIMDVSLWVDKNFNKLEEIINEFIQNNNNNEFLYGMSINENDDSLEDSESYDCGFLTYN